MFYDRRNDYELSSIATIKLWLRRTLVLYQFYSASCPPPFEMVLQTKHFPRQRGIIKQLSI
jgi:hypothetical protein